MVRVEIKTAKDGFTATLKGHAEFNPGNDIVCAAISTLSGTLAAACANVKGSHIYYNDLPGDQTIRVWGVTVWRQREEVKTILKTVLIGLKQIENEYPKNISVFFDDF
jgi:uncharacterized protein YsxB (DUF464 family)